MLAGAEECQRREEGWSLAQHGVGARTPGLLSCSVGGLLGGLRQDLPLLGLCGQRRLGAPLSFGLHPCLSFPAPSSPLPGDCLLHAASLTFLASLANVPSATAWAPLAAGPQPAQSTLGSLFRRCAPPGLGTLLRQGPPQLSFYFPRGDSIASSEAYTREDEEGRSWKTLEGISALEIRMTGPGEERGTRGKLLGPSSDLAQEDLQTLPMPCGQCQDMESIG